MKLKRELERHVPEKFPPLCDVVQIWSNERILSEVGRLWTRSIAFAHIACRDEILISAPAQARLTDSELEALLSPSGVPDVRTWAYRLGVVMTVLVQTKDLDRQSRSAHETVSVRARSQ